MRVLEQSEVRIDWADLDSRTFHKRLIQPRSSGVHLSGVIKHVLTSTGKLKPTEFDEDFPLRMALGVAWEEFIVTLMEDMIWQPGEVSSDGISGSPDGVSRINGEGCLEEFKLTWKSSFTRKDITKELGWMWQLMGYCYMMGLLQARIHVMWVCGDYRGSGPQFFRYHIQFTQRELNEFWRKIILANKQEAIAEQH